MTLTEITDDLTGAADSGSYYTARGQRLKICLSGDADMSPSDTDIVAVNLSSRNVEKEKAHNLHNDLLKKIQILPDQVFFKKIGTGFRGNDQYELAGMLDAWPDYNVFIIDNAPDLGTFTLYGHQYCEGQILHKSLYSKDPISPPTKSFIPDILSEGMDYKIGLVDIDAVKTGKAAERTSELLSNGCRIIVFDAITKKDTLDIISTLVPLYPKTFWTGSLGIADGLGEYFFGPWQKTRFPARELRCLGFSASDYDSVRKQNAYSEKLGMRLIRVDIDTYIDGNESIIENSIEAALDAVKTGNIMIIQKVEKYSHKAGTNLKILECFRKIVRPVCCSSDFDRLIISGGETAQTIFSVLSTEHISVGRPIAPGIAQGTILDGLLKGKEYALKGGSMGRDDALEKMMCRKEVIY